MRIYNSLDEVNIENDTVVTIGKFDGLHRGHKTICEKIASVQKESDLESVVITFVDSPHKVIGGVNAKQIVTNSERRMLFKESGFDIYVECPFDKKLMSTLPEDFIKLLVEKFNMKVLVVGDDFRFGYKGSGDTVLLEEYSGKLGFKLVILDKLQEDDVDISSTRIREEIRNGHISKANSLMGRNYFIYGKVVRGRQIGRRIDFPTINIIPSDDKLIPSNGVYLTIVEMQGERYEGITNVGVKPTFTDDNSLCIETHIFNFNENVYDKDVKIVFLEEMRPEIKFESVDALKTQLERDKTKGLEYFEKLRSY